jgi:hypothetical protein
MGMEIDYKAQYALLKEELTPKITAPSLYPEGATVPIEIAEAVEKLKQLEPQIIEMGVNRIFSDNGGPYILAQKIQCYYFSRNILDDPIVLWAGGVASKFILQRRLREARPAQRRKATESLQRSMKRR